MRYAVVLAAVGPEFGNDRGAYAQRSRPDAILVPFQHFNNHQTSVLLRTRLHLQAGQFRTSHYVSELHLRRHSLHLFCCIPRRRLEPICSNDRLPKAWSSSRQVKRRSILDATARIAPPICSSLFSDRALLESNYRSSTKAIVQVINSLSFLASLHRTAPCRAPRIRLSLQPCNPTTKKSSWPRCDRSRTTLLAMSKRKRNGSRLGFWNPLSKF